MHELEERMLLFFTGMSRTADVLLDDQRRRTESGDEAMIEALRRVEEIGALVRDALEAGDTTRFGELMHEHWLEKRERSQGMSDPNIDRWYDVGRANGAVGGKLIGAGGGGFLLFLRGRPAKLRAAMAQEGLARCASRSTTTARASSCVRDVAAPQIVILAGGLGTRMRHVAGDLPKALLPVCGEPFIHHQLRLLRRQGVGAVVLVTGYQGELIEDAVGDGGAFDLSVSYVDEGEELHGTAGRFASPSTKARCRAGSP